MTLFVDDEKLPEWFGLPGDTYHAHSAEEALVLWQTGKFNTMHLDHDLGAGWDGSRLLSNICISNLRPIKVFCISLNPVGVMRIKGVCADYMVPFEDIGRREMFARFSPMNGQSG